MQKTERTSTKCRDVRTAPGQGTVYCMTELLNELLTRMYSDEGTMIGELGPALWPVLYDELREWLIRSN